MRKTVLAILSGVAIVLSTVALVPNEAAAQRGGGFRGAADLEWGCPGGLGGGSPGGGSGGWAGRVDFGAGEAGDGGGAGDGASL